MSLTSGINDEALRKFLRTLSPQEFLFQQGEMGNTMFIITSGSIELVEKRGAEQVVVGTLGPGQLLGEKAVLQETPYPRTYSARAKAECSLLEFEMKNIKIIAAIIPDFTLRILQTAAKRLDRANELIDLLRPFDPAMRMVKCLRFLARQSGVKTAMGIEISTSIEEIYSIASIDRGLIGKYLNLLVVNKILLPGRSGFILVDENALEQFAPQLGDRAAA